MSSFQIDILNPKAGKLLRDLADLNLIAIREINGSADFVKIVKKIRNKAKGNAPSFEEINREVELVRAKRYAQAKR